MKKGFPNEVTDDRQSWTHVEMFLVLSLSVSELDWLHTPRTQETDAAFRGPSENTESPCVLTSRAAVLSLCNNLHIHIFMNNRSLVLSVKCRKMINEKYSQNISVIKEPIKHRKTT